MSYDPQNPGAKNPYASGSPEVPRGGQIPGAPPPGYPYPVAAADEGDKTGGLIPYKNPKALIAYYLGIGSLLCFIGIPLGVASIILGVMGLKARAANPVIKGSVHAWIGIVLGTLSLIVHLAVIGVTIAGIMSQPSY